MPWLRRTLLWSAIWLVGHLAVESPRAAAEVAVLNNRTSREIIVEVVPGGGAAHSLILGSGDSRPVFFQRLATVRFGNRFATQSQELVSAAVYFFAFEADGQTLRMERIGLGPSDSQPKELAPFSPNAHFNSAVVTIPVKIAVDDDEPTHRTVWEPRLRQRVEQASNVLEQYCGLKLSVGSVATWESDDKVRDFSRSMSEFERKVPATPARLVVGFSSQYDFTIGPVHMGGSRGPLYPYILLKERAPNLRDPEKLELLVHELCHFLGASHSPEPTSVMRPLLSISQLRSAGAKIYIDPVNTLLMSLLSDELRQREVRTFSDVSVATKQRMLEIYQILQQALPGDPAAIQYQHILGFSNSPQLANEVRVLLGQLTRFARFEQARAAKAGVPIAGDDLTTRYVREAAAICAELDSPDAAKAMILALGIFMDDSATLRMFPGTSGLVNQVETDEQRRSRVSVMGRPAMQGRQDIAKHFFVSAHLLVTMGGSAARSVGLAKETLDAQGGSGFSFADMAANRAGIIFAEKVLASEITLEEIASLFTVDKFLPVIDDLAEGLNATKLRKKLGTDAESNLSAELLRIEQRILDLPIYQAAH